MGFRRPAAIVSPESIASILVGILAVVVVAAQVVASPPTTASSSPSPEPTASAAPAAGMPPLIGSSLATILIVNERLAVRAQALGQAIASKKPVADDIATILRLINTEMAVGNDGWFDVGQRQARGDLFRADMNRAEDVQLGADASEEVTAPDLE